jgi:hypothetical protein
MDKFNHLYFLKIHHPPIYTYSTKQSLSFGSYKKFMLAFPIFIMHITMSYPSHHHFRSYLSLLLSETHVHEVKLHINLQCLT